MIKKLIVIIPLFISLIGFSQSYTTSPLFPQADQPFTLTVDVTGTSLEGYAGDVWIWSWLPDCTANCDAPTNVDPATGAQSDALMTRMSANSYQITFTPTTFFSKTASEITRFGFKLKSVSWNDGIQSDVDMIVEISDGALSIKFTNPEEKSTFIDLNGSIQIVAASPVTADLSILQDDQVVASTNGTTVSFSYTATTSETVEFKAIASLNTETEEDAILITTRTATEDLPRPEGIIPGINYGMDDTSVTLCLEAPNKSSVFVLGDFNDWQPSSTYQMTRDGDFFWLTLNGLTSGEEYAYQYFVDESLYVGDPYADKVLDPDDDQYISDTTYPNLKEYPEGAVGIVPVLQTNQTVYQWQVDDFVAPESEELVIYEVLVRDFDQGQNYQAVIDRLDYIQDLGINAIELMPIMEFDGNLSWGYNPSYFFAPDKFYGTKNDLKGLIDACHARGIAVILDMVLNQTWGDNPLAQLYWNGSKPAADNPWLNEDATHPYNVFNDFNHESLYTQAFVDTVNHYWLNEYRFDGYRFDLSKGFTQNFTDDVGAWSSYDQSRVKILTRMVDEIRAHSPESYVIFEHLGDNSEEKVLADYGILMWGNMNHNYNQLSKGDNSSSNIEWTYHGSRNWNEPNAVTYMESHDEERLMVRNKNEGNSSNGGHNVKTQPIGLERVKTASSVYFSIPGPKMIWQFGELGYDIPIDQNGRTGEKPDPWENDLNYINDPDRMRLYDVTAALADLKTSYSIFNTSNVTINQNQSLVKQIMLTNENYTASPSSTSEMNLVTLANFNVTTTSVTGQFPHDGSWYEYFSSGEEIVVNNQDHVISMQPGEFRIYTDVKLGSVDQELTNYVQPIAPSGLTAVDGVGGVKLTWNDNSGIETSYRILRKSDGDYKEVQRIASSSESYTDTSIDFSTTYTYKVEAVNAHYESESNEVFIDPAPLSSIIRDSEVTLFPNPVHDTLRVFNLSDVTDAVLIDFIGRELPIVWKRGAEGGFWFNMRPFEAGIYILKVSGREGVYSRKIIKE